MANIFNNNVSVLGDLTLGTLNGTGNFLTLDGLGVVRFRTPSEVLADLGPAIKVSSNDTTSGYLEDKITNGKGIVQTTLNEAGNEQVELEMGPHYLGLASTGVYTGGGLEAGATIGTFDIVSGEGFYIDANTDFANVVAQAVVIAGRTNIAITNLLTHPVSYISVDKDDNIIQSTTFPTEQERRQFIFLGVVVHSDNVNVIVTNNLPVVANNVMAQMYDRWNAQGDYFNISGNILSPNGANLSMDISAGEVFKTSINYDTDKNNPHTQSFTSETALTFRYRLRGSEEEGDTTVVETNFYDLNGIKTAVPDNKYTVQRISIFPSKTVRIQYGQNLYDSLSDAEAHAALESYVEEPNLRDNALFRAHLIVEHDATDLSNIQCAKFIEAARSGIAKETNIGGGTFENYILNEGSTGKGPGLGGEITVNSGNPALFDVQAGTGRVIDNTTDPLVPVLKEVRWDNFIGVAVPNIATTVISYVAIDADNNLIIQSADFTPSDRRDYVILGRLGHIDNATITQAASLSIPLINPLLTTIDLAKAIGSINTTGNTFSFNGANLTLDKIAGTQFSIGSNEIINPKDPHSSTQGPLTGLTFLPVWRDGLGGISVGTPTTNIDTTQWDDGSGALQTVGNNKYTFQRLYHFSSNLVVVAYGQKIYQNMDETILGVSNDPFERPALAGPIARASIALRKGVTSLIADDTRSRIVEGNKFGDFSGGGGGGGTSSNLQAIYDNSTPNPEILTNPTNGAFTLRVGSGADSDIGFDLQNLAATSVFSVTGEGDVALVGLLDGRDVALDGTTQDSHIADATIHFTQADISITESQISDLQAYMLSSQQLAVTKTLVATEFFTSYDSVTGLFTSATPPDTDTVYVHPNHSGDVTSVADGATTIANDAVTYAKIQNVVANNVLLGNNAGAGGIVDELTATEVRALLNVEDGSTADQTTIVGITGTKAQFNTALTDGTFLFVGDAPTAHTHTESDITDLQDYVLVGGDIMIGSLTAPAHITAGGTASDFVKGDGTLDSTEYATTTLVGSAEEEEINFAGGEATWVLSATPSVLFPHRLYAGTTSGGGLILLDEGVDYTISGATITYLSPVLPIDVDEKHIIHYNLPQAPSGYSDPNSEVKIRNADMYDVINTNAYYKDGPIADRRNLQMMIVTDLHGDVTATQNAVTMMNEFSTIDGGINLGDTCVNTWADDFTFVDPFMSIGKPVLIAIGNHDEGLGYTIASTGSTSAAYTRFVQPYEASIAGTHAGKSYYYKDWDSYNIRMIMLYEYDDNDDVDPGDPLLYRVAKTTRVWSQAQIDWLISTLEGTPAGYSVVIAMHQIVQDQMTWVSGIFTDINGIAIGDSSTSIDEAIIPDIVNAYINGTTIVGGSYAFSGDASYKTNLTVDADFTTRGAGEFICYMAGHAHVDVIATVPAYSDQTQLVLTCSTSNSNRNKYGDVQRQVGKRSEDCINVVSFDTVNKQIKIARIGAQITHDMRKRDFIAIDY